MTDIYESIRRLFVPIRREGYPFIAIAAVAAIARRAGMRVERRGTALEIVLPTT